MVSQARSKIKGGGPSGREQFITYEVAMPVPHSVCAQIPTTRDEIAAQNLTVARKLALALAKRVPDEVVEKYSHNQAKYTSLKKRLFLAQLYPAFMMEILLANG